MQFVITAYDGPNMLEKRMEVRPRHLQNLSRLKGKFSAPVESWTRLGR